jgi:excisionase family DNA binding protein
MISEQREGDIYMDHYVEKLLYSRRDAAEALSLSVRSIDYLITTNRLASRRVGGKILIPASAVRRFAREDHPESVRSATVSTSLDARTKRLPRGGAEARFQPRSEMMESKPSLVADGSR